ncbi:hypothetical protein O1611_g4477 [Lasiodiplodia mahajangana]|uniref:Uncharacterized protein n=1 Tax=Lasiodiplodia mahajangana TaxID=1108764 RepID=A0ACC2JNS9_9PEZI|nr:hypothetical protein O1611_g4477 [Lasiodiplodia mahajangana]
MTSQDSNNTGSTPKYRRIQEQSENPFASLIPDQQIAIIPSFTLESGVTLHNVPLAYTTRGKLSPNADNVMVICHALTGSADVSDWWGPLIGGPGRAFDTSRFFVVCMNSLGSPYGTASPVTAKDGDPEKGNYGPEFPLTTIRDDVNLHKLLLDELGVREIAAVIGGSMGGMLVLEWAYFGKDYVRCIVPIATSSQHSAWGISWGEAQRQSIYADPKYEDGYYTFSDPPATGLGAARMAALLTYRSRNSFEARFGRNIPDPARRQTIRERPRPATPSEAHFQIHNDGHKTKRLSANSSRTNTPSQTQTPNSDEAASRKLDTHDISRYRAESIAQALALIEQPTLVLGIESDGLFTFAEQEELAEHIKNARLEKIDSQEGHDAFLLQFEQVNRYILEFLNEIMPDIMKKEGEHVEAASVGQLLKSSTFGEAEVEDITAW